jgi:V8-like Glu-specific endopeptidase
MLRTILRSFLGSSATPTRATPRPRPARRARLQLEGLEERLTPSNTWINNGNIYPYSAAVHLLMTFPSGRSFIGSGALIDRFHVLTAGHCTYDSREGGWARSITVYAGETNGSTYVGTANATYMRTFNSFINDDRSSSTGSHTPGDGDIGLITLDRTLGDRTGWFGYGYNNNSSFFTNLSVTKLGYPGSPYSGVNMLMDWGRLIGTNGGKNGFDSVRWSTSQMTAIGGESGSGIYAGNYMIYAVHDLGGSGYGYGERITQSVFTQLRTWCSSDATPRSAAAFSVLAAQAGVPGHATDGDSLGGSVFTTNQVAVALASSSLAKPATQSASSPGTTTVTVAADAGRYYVTDLAYAAAPRQLRLRGVGGDALLATVGDLGGLSLYQLLAA